MPRILKYPIEIADKFSILFYNNSSLLSVQVQDGKPFMWVRSDEKEHLVEVQFRIIGTGQEINEENIQYFATFQIPPHVWHLFIKKPVPKKNSDVALPYNLLEDPTIKRVEIE